MTNQEFQELVEINKKLGGKYDAIVEQLAEDLEFNETRSTNSSSNDDTLDKLKDLYNKINLFVLFRNTYNTRFSDGVSKSDQLSYYLGHRLGGDSGVYDAFKDYEQEYIKNNITQIDLNEFVRLYNLYSGSLTGSDVNNYKRTFDFIQSDTVSIIDRFLDVQNLYNFCQANGQAYLDFMYFLEDHNEEFEVMAKSLIYTEELRSNLEIAETLRSIFYASCNNASAVVQELFSDFINKYPENCFNFYQERLELAYKKDIEARLDKYQSKIERIEDNPDLLEEHKDILEFDVSRLPLFDNDPRYAANPNADGISPDDVQQGFLGDCNFLAAVSGVAQANPQLIANMITENSDGTFTVSLHIMQNDGNRQLTDIVITREMVFVKGTDDPAYANIGDGELWIMVLEKAYAKAMGNFEQIDGLMASEVLEVLTGRPSTSIKTDAMPPTFINDMQNALNNNQVVIFGSKDSTDVTHPNKQARFGDPVNGFEVTLANYTIVLDHGYSLMAVNPNNGTVSLRNPHSKNHLINITQNDLQLFFSRYTFA